MSDQPKRHFDLTFNLGHAIIIASMLAGLIGSHYVGDYKIATLEKKADAIEAKIDRLGTIWVDIAVDRQRINELARRLEIVERRP